MNKPDPDQLDNPTSDSSGVQLLIQLDATNHSNTDALREPKTKPTKNTTQTHLGVFLSFFLSFASL